MTGVWDPCDRNASCNSRPLNPGICRSVIRHAVSAAILDLRKSSADPKVMVLYPKDSISSRMPSRASASSSTIEINGALDIPVLAGIATNLAMERQLLFKKFDLAQLADGCRVSRFVTKRT